MGRVAASFRKATLGASDQWAIAVIVLAQFAVIWGYYFLFESLRDGQTPGKRLLGLRVVLESGHGLTPSAAAARNLVRVLDMQPGVSYLVGLVAAAVSRRGKRLGDVVAGTIVVREQALSTLGTAPAVSEARRLVRLLTDDELSVLDRYVARRQAIDGAHRGGIAVQLAERFRARVPAAEVAALGGGSDAAWLLRLHERETSARQAGSRARGSDPNAAAAWAIVQGAAPRWLEFASLVADVQRRGGLRALEADAVSDFVARYRELSTDLARLETAARGRQLDERFQLARLVAAGHNLLYRRRSSGVRTPLRYVARDVSAEVRRSWRPIAFAALVLFGPATAAFEAVRRHPELTTELVPASLIDRAEEGVAREKRGRGGYLSPQDARVRGPAMASMIMANNVQITYVAFAFGVTAGIGTVLLLVSNGVGALGAPWASTPAAAS